MKTTKEYNAPFCEQVDLMAETAVMASSTNNYIEDLEIVTGSWGE